jgi:ABC-type multidrug transport system fused ATPase/permease subunit
MHDNLLRKIFTLPMSFFDTQPPGRLLARFSNDVANNDLSLPGLYLGLSEYVVGTVVTALVVTGGTKGVVLIALVPLVPLYLSMTRHYLKASREMNRLLMIANSPVLNHFGETFSGLMTVRAFNKQVRARCIPFFRKRNELVRKKKRENYSYP